MANQILAGHPNVYQYLFETFGSRTLTPVVWAPYLPLYYFIEAGWLFALRLLGLMDAGTWYFDPYWHIQGFNRSLFYVKAVYIPFDLGTGYLLSRLVDESRRKIVWILWSFSPASLLITFMMGQNDVMPTFFLVAAMYFGEKALTQSRRGLPGVIPSVAALLLLSLGAGIKTFPLLLVLPFAIVLGRTIGRFILLGLAGTIPFLILIAPFLRTEAFLKGSLLNHEGQALLNLSLSNGANSASVFVMAYALLIIYLSYKRTPFSPYTIRHLTLAITTLVFVVGPWPFNWFMWLVPFTVLAAAENSYLFPLFAVQAAHFLVWTLSWGNLLGAGLFTPIYATAAKYPSLRDVVSAIYPYPKLASISYSIFVVASLIMLFAAVKSIAAKRLSGLPADHVDEIPRDVLLLVPTALLVALLVVAFALGASR